MQFRRLSLQLGMFRPGFGFGLNLYLVITLLYHTYLGNPHGCVIVVHSTMAAVRVSQDKVDVIMKLEYPFGLTKCELLNNR